MCPFRVKQYHQLFRQFWLAMFLQLMLVGVSAFYYWMHFTESTMWLFHRLRCNVAGITMTQYYIIILTINTIVGPANIHYLHIITIIYTFLEINVCLLDLQLCLLLVTACCLGSINKRSDIYIQSGYVHHHLSQNGLLNQAITPVSNWEMGSEGSACVTECNVCVPGHDPLTFFSVVLSLF